ncbi:uncharacterized protein LOC129588858 [Paramacrobiotus metropolitanus]|uniref:uncharacterized protein LOC129588858 n=1 Tax=Paramacrobiotus metropolitanus TaxID=2943436 RepID=UPI002445B75B|nr:uncharacterized protein LOC129588858 [Paramacrobiotus metropolitanus]
MDNTVPPPANKGQNRFYRLSSSSTGSDLSIMTPENKVPFYKRWVRDYIDSFKPMDPSQPVKDVHGHPIPADHEKDPESNTPKPLPSGTGNIGLKHELKNRHMQMIAIGGAIGTGLFIGSGGVLAQGGPASLLIGFALIGSMLFNVVMALGELAVMYPIAGSFSVYASRFIDPAWGFAMGWNYALQWLVVLPLELTASAITINYWTDGQINSGYWIGAFLVAIIIINFFGVKGYGEAEFLFSMIKVIAVLGFIVLAVVIDCGGAPQGGYRGVKTWSEPGAFNNGFLGFISIFVTGAFAFGGTELVGLAAAESANPRKTLPRATKQVFWRVTIFYIVSLFLVGLLVPFNHPQLLNANSSVDITASPFVIAINEAGIKVLPSIFNGVILVSVLSVGNSSVYGSSRTLCAMAHQGQAPKFLGYVDRQGRPLFAIIIALVIGLLAFINETAASDTIFNWLLAISGLSTIFTWASICWAHIRFRQAWKAQGHTLDELPFRATFGVWGSWWGIIFNVAVLIGQFYLAVAPLGGSNDSPWEVFFKAYLAAPVTLLFFVIWKLWKKTPFMVTGKGSSDRFFLLKTETIDLLSGRRDIDLKDVLAEERAAHAQLPVWKRCYVSFCG